MKQSGNTDKQYIKEKRIQKLPNKEKGQKSSKDEKKDRQRMKKEV